MLASGEDILKYIPQRPPIVMIDSLLDATEVKIVSGLTVLGNNIFIENGKLNESGLVEHIAQTAAAGIGYKQVKNNSPVNLGYIAAIRSLHIYELPKVGSKLQTTLEVVNEVMEITIVKAQVTYIEKIVAECEMRIFTKTE